MIGLFKGKYPDFDVFCEEIAKTQNDEPEPDLEDYIFLDITRKLSRRYFLLSW